MAIVTEGEVLPPASRAGSGWKVRAGQSVFDDEHLDLLSHLLDDFIRIPGTPIRFGLDGIVGFIPGIGDVLGGLASTILIFAAWVRGVPPVTVARMVANVAIETVVGAVPVLGNLFDIGWRANRRNYKLLVGSVASTDGERRRHSFWSWAFFAGVALVLVSLMLLPGVLLVWLLAHLRGR
jgi:hypothetical protein